MLFRSTQEAQAGLHFKQHGLDKEQAGQPITSPQKGKDSEEDQSPNTTRSTNLEGEDLE